MTTDLIPVQHESISGETVSTVDARTLHTFLEIGKDFSSWMKDRIQQYGFLENQDFAIVFPNSGENPQGGRPAKEYHITLDMAKELSMVERNEQGRKARRYFIQKEKEALGIIKPDTAATLDILFYEAAIRNLNVSDASKIKSLTDRGLRYGKNLINPHNEKETQPHLYEDTFPELLDMLNSWVQQAA